MADPHDQQDQAAPQESGAQPDLDNPPPPTDAKSKRAVTPPDAGPHDMMPVEKRPNVGTVTPDDYPKDDPAGSGKPDWR